MTANAGYKAYATGDVLTAAQVQYNLQNQTVMYFATSAARTTAIGSVTVEGMVTYIPANGLEYYNGSGWITLSTGGDITGVTAGTGITGGGTSGTVTVTNDMATTITAAGDLIRGTGSGTYSRLGIGSTGDVLTVAGGQPSWAAAASSGGMTLLSTTALSTTSVTISSISTTYKSLYVVIRDMAPSSSGNMIFMQVNGDTGSNYQTTAIYGTGTAFASEVNNSTAKIVLNASPKSVNTTADNEWIINFYDYANTAAKRVITYAGVYTESGGANVMINGTCSYLAVGTAISSITLLCGAGFGAGSALVYGVN
jgi:hypothetical protein